MIELARLRGLAVVAPSVLLGLVFLDSALGATLGLSPGFVEPEVKLSPWDSDEAGSKVSGLALELENEKGKRPLGVFVGMSSTFIGVDTEELDERCGELRWALLTGKGGHFEKIAHLSCLLALLEPRPRCVVLAVQPSFLSRGPRTAPDVVRLEAEASVPERPRVERAVLAARAYLKSRSWIDTNRYRANLRLRDRLFELRLALLVRLGVPAKKLFPPDPAPRAVPVPLRRQLSSPEVRGFVSGQWDSYDHEHAWFDPESYSTTGAQARYLVRAIEVSRSLGARVGIVLMPESSELRARIPAEAERCFRAVIAEHFPGDAPPIRDLRSSLGDDAFADLNHVHEDGRRRTTELVAAFVKELLPR